MNDISQQIQQQISDAKNNNNPLKIQAGNSKNTYTQNIKADILDISQHQGIISYEPTELFITARAGTPLNEIQSLLDDNQQILAFEPPQFKSSATIGGTVACNLSGPARAYRGACRDFVLGCKIINGNAEQLKFGGEVMKNVAGYDASRLMCGAYGTLGVLLDISLKVIPKPEFSLSIITPCDIHQALKLMHQWVNHLHPISASYYDGIKLVIRLSGNEASIKSSHKKIGGDVLENESLFWKKVKEQKDIFFTSEKTIWRLSLASNTPPLTLQGETLYEWGGALRWLKTSESADDIRACLDNLGGHAVIAKNNFNNAKRFHPLNKTLYKVHKNLKTAFDPQHILNPDLMFKDI